jgi:protein-disulfide isomerase
VAAVAVIVLILLALTPWESDGDGSVTEFVTPTPRPADIPRQGSTLGNPDAPLTIVEYSDFLCPYCKRAALETMPQIEEEYIAAGKVKLVFKHLVVHGEEAALAAGAAECASAQNAFWQYHDTLFLNNESVDFNSENLKRFAQGLGLDTEAFNTCLDSEEYMDKLVADVDEARRRGVSSTPTFFVGQTEIEGAKSYADFKKAIDDELARLSGTPEAE